MLMIKNKFKTNPLLEINISEGKILAKEPLSNEVLEINERVLEILDYLIRERSYENLKQFLKKKLGEQLDADSIIKELIQKKLISNHKNYRPAYDWKKFGWYHPLHFLNSITKSDFLDSGQSYEKKLIMHEIKKYLKWDPIPLFFKSYSESKKILLPNPEEFKNETLCNVLLRRRTSRVFHKKNISLKDLSKILFYSTKFARERRFFTQKGYKRNPLVLRKSLFNSFECYMIVLRVTNLEKGIYHYNMEKHHLELIKKSNFEKSILKISNGQYVDKSSVVFIFTSVFDRHMWRYRHERAYVNLLVDMAKFAHLFILTSTALNLRNFLTPAIIESETDKLIGVDGFHEGSLYLVAIGH